jgi:CRISPR/Cas system endoribonuclease Cas6 (RAMP superfamily)
VGARGAGTQALPGKASMFFSEEKNQKTFVFFAYRYERQVPCSGSRVIKVFCFFSSEKKSFLQWLVAET